MQLFDKALSLIGKGKSNTSLTSESLIKSQLFEPRPLPMGLKEFNEWSERIISGALVAADKESQRFALASMIITLGPQESHKPDAHFIHTLRKTASNQIAVGVMEEIKGAQKIRIEKAKAEIEAKKTPEQRAEEAKIKADEEARGKASLEVLKARSNEAQEVPMNAIKTGKKA